jgi:hypothetical protein
MTGYWLRNERMAREAAKPEPAAIPSDIPLVRSDHSMPDPQDLRRRMHCSVPCARGSPAGWSLDFPPQASMNSSRWPRRSLIATRRPAVAGIGIECNQKKLMLPEWIRHKTAASMERFE